MKCAYHPTADAVHNCHTCVRSLCETCSHQIRGSFYCQDCLIRGAEWAAAVKDLRLPRDSAKRAGLMALIPGMGAVYNGEYSKALTYLVVFFTLAAAGDMIHEVFAFATFIFYIFMIFDAYRSAEAIQRQRLQGGSLPAPTADVTSPVWGGLLVVLGLLLTLINFDILSLARFRRLWPVGVILLGLYLVYRSLAREEPPPPDLELTERNRS